eukprot:scaffold154595_cov32-Prasinocladus_malaysianus.AAC.1
MDCATDPPARPHVCRCWEVAGVPPGFCPRGLASGQLSYEQWGPSEPGRPRPNQLTCRGPRRQHVITNMLVREIIYSRLQDVKGCVLVCLR